MRSYEDLQKRRQQTRVTDGVKNLVSQGDKALEKWIKVPGILIEVNSRVYGTK